MYRKCSFISLTAVIIIFAVCIGPAAAYTNAEKIWTSSGNQLIEENLANMAYVAQAPDHYREYYKISVTPKGTPVLITPFVTSINKNGVTPEVRYLWVALKMPKGVNVTNLYVENGRESVYATSDVKWEGTGTYKEYKLDMGSYHAMNRGILIALKIKNDLDTNQYVYTYGAGAKLEW